MVMKDSNIETVLNVTRCLRLKSFATNISRISGRL